MCLDINAYNLTGNILNNYAEIYQEAMIKHNKFASEYMKNKVVCRNKQGGIIHVDKSVFDEDSDLVGLNKNRISSNNNPNAKVINIFDHKGNLRYTTNGNFKKIIRQYSLPYGAFMYSYKNNGIIVGHNKQSRAELRKRCKQNFIGWYALLEGYIQCKQNIDFNIEKEQNTGLTCKLRPTKEQKILSNKLAQEKMKEQHVNKEITKHELRNVKGSITKLKKSKFFSICDKYDNIIEPIIAKKEVHKRFNFLLITDEDHHYNSNKSHESFISKKYGVQYIGSYLKELDLSEKQKDEYIFSEIYPKFEDLIKH